MIRREHHVCMSVCLCRCVHECVSVCVRECVRECVHACGRACVMFHELHLLSCRSRCHVLSRVHTCSVRACSVLSFVPEAMVRDDRY